MLLVSRERNTPVIYLEQHLLPTIGVETLTDWFLLPFIQSFFFLSVLLNPCNSTRPIVADWYPTMMGINFQFAIIFNLNRNIVCTKGIMLSNVKEKLFDQNNEFFFNTYIFTSLLLNIKII